MNKKQLLLTITTVISLTGLMAQVNVNNTAPYDDPIHLVNSVLLGNGVTASNITFTGQAAQIGFFNGGLNGNPALGLDSGIVISSGDVLDIPPGGNQPSTGQYSGPGDPDLLTIAQSVTSNPQAAQITTTQDAAFLEFDFRPVGDTIEFDFVFASEEYTGFINSTFNDVFAFFLSGPGISGPFASPAAFPNGAVNVALVPGTTDPITISTIYDEPLQTPPQRNAQYYIDNSAESSHEFNGFTTVITVRYPVQCGELYHFKFAIADCQDDWLDTGVFLKGGSLSSNGVGITASTPFPNNTIIEECGEAQITISRSDIVNNDTIKLAVSGNATASDYTSFPTTHVFDPGSTSLTFNIEALIDNITEDIDTLTIEILGNNGCNEVTLLIEDYTPMSISVSDSINICTELGESGEIWANITDGKPPFVYNWDNGVGPGDTLNVTPEETTFYIPTVTDACAKDIVGLEVPVWVQCPVELTNVFTPNGDGINDFFEIINLDDYIGPSLKVFDRWGRVVYESENYLNDWDGGDAVNGTYFYITSPNSIKYEYDSDAKDELKYTLKGFVQILR